MDAQEGGGGGGGRAGTRYKKVGSATRSPGPYPFPDML